MQCVLPITLIVGLQHASEWESSPPRMRELACTTRETKLLPEEPRGARAVQAASQRR